MSIAPNMLSEYLSLEGVIGLGLSFGLYTVSLASRGKRSWVHVAFYNHLRLLSPTKESVAILAGVTGSTKHSPTNRSTPGPHSSQLEQRLAALELAAGTVGGGMVAVTAMKTKETAVVWKTLESACSLLLAGVIALALRSIRLWSTDLYKPCCSDAKCWKEWFVAEDTTKPILVFLLLMAWNSVSHLGTYTSTLPPGSPLRYAPSSYMTGWIFGLAVLTPLMPRQLPAALEELAARIILFIRLLGIRVEQEQDLLVTMTSGAQLALAIGVGFVGFVIAEPVSSSVQLGIYQWFAGRAAANRQQQQQLLVSTVMLLTLILPMASLWLAYSATEQWHSLQQICVWLWIGTLYYLTKPLLQTHLDRSLPAIKQILESKSELTSDKIFYPFKHRYNRLLETGIKLSVLPSVLVILLSLTALCRSSTSIYPVGYGGPVGTRAVHEYLEARAFEMTHRTDGNHHPTLVSRWLAIQTCPTPLPPRRKQQAMKDVVPLPNMERGRDLLKHVPLPPMTIAGALTMLQSSSKRDERQKLGENVGAKEILVSLLKHPFFTSTIARPILELLTTVLTVWWLISLFYALAFSHRLRQEIGKYSFDIEQSQKSQ